MKWVIPFLFLLILLVLPCQGQFLFSPPVPRPTATPFPTPFPRPTPFPEPTPKPEPTPEHIHPGRGQRFQIDPGQEVNDPERTGIEDGGKLHIKDGGKLHNQGMDVGQGSNCTNDAAGSIFSEGSINIGGTVDNDGMITATDPVTIAPGGTLSGEGTLTAPVVNNAGTLISTGSGPTIMGNLVNDPGSATVITAPQATVKVSGNVTLGGNLTPSYTPSTGNVATIITSGGKITGEFSSITNPVNPKGIVQATVIASGGVKVADLRPMQGQEVQVSSPLPVESRPLLVSALAPNAAALTLPANITLSNMRMISALLENYFDDPAVGLWAASHGDFTSLGSSPKKSRYTTAGFSVGGETKVRDFLFGVAAGYSRTWADTIYLNTGWGALYATYSKGGFYANGAIVGGGDTFDTTRVALLGNARASSCGFMLLNFYEAGYKWKLGHLSVGPFSLFQYGWTSTMRFSESGSAAPVTVHASNESSLLTDLGLKVNYDFKKVTIFTNLAWEHEYLNSASVSVVNLVDIPSSVTTVSGPNLGHDSLIVSAGLSYKLTKSISIAVGYIGQLGRKNEESNSVTGNVRIGF